jgi:hypothetical protein
MLCYCVFGDVMTQKPSLLLRFVILQKRSGKIKLSVRSYLVQLSGSLFQKAVSLLVSEPALLFTVHSVYTAWL